MPSTFCAWPTSAGSSSRQLQHVAQVHAAPAATLGDDAAALASSACGALLALATRLGLIGGGGEALVSSWGVEPVASAAQRGSRHTCSSRYAEWAAAADHHGADATRIMHVPPVISHTYIGSASCVAG
jgi:hypothetical protein